MTTTVTCSRCGRTVEVEAGGTGPVTRLVAHWEKWHGGVPEARVRS